jgi:hypothetical protein
LGPGAPAPAESLRRDTPDGDKKANGGSLPPRHFVALQSSHIRSRSVGTPSALPPRGDAEATRVVALVGIVGLVGRFRRLPREAAAGAREDPPSPRPSVVRLPPSQSLRRDMMKVKPRTPECASWAESPCTARPCLPAGRSRYLLGAGAHHVGLSPIRIDSRHSRAVLFPSVCSACPPNCAGGAVGSWQSLRPKAASMLCANARLKVVQ